MAKTYFVRLKPFNKKRGFLVRNYLYRGIRFTTRWKEVSAAKAEELQHIIQPHDEEAEIALFDIKSKDEALVIEENERDAAVAPRKQVDRVKSAERVPDRKFRDDQPTISEDGEILEGNVEAGEAIQDQPAPAPKLKSGAKKRSKRTSTRK